MIADSLSFYYYREHSYNQWSQMDTFWSFAARGRKKEENKVQSLKKNEVHFS